MIDILRAQTSSIAECEIAKITSNGVESDHTAVRPHLTMTSLKQKMTTALTCGTINWRKIATDQATSEHYTKILLATTEPVNAMPYEDFNALIIAAGTEAALLVNSTCDDWFQFSLLEAVPQRPTLYNIDYHITFEEVNAAINKLKKWKKPGTQRHTT